MKEINIVNLDSVLNLISLRNSIGGRIRGEILLWKIIEDNFEFHREGNCWFAYLNEFGRNNISLGKYIKKHIKSSDISQSLVDDKYYFVVIE
jgi:hypothetical protein